MVALSRLVAFSDRSRKRSGHLEGGRLQSFAQMHVPEISELGRPAGLSTSMRKATVVSRTGPSDISATRRPGWNSTSKTLLPRRPFSTNWNRTISRPENHLAVICAAHFHVAKQRLLDETSQLDVIDMRNLRLTVPHPLLCTLNFLFEEDDFIVDSVAIDETSYTRVHCGWTCRIRAVVITTKATAAERRHFPRGRSVPRWE